MLHNGRSDSTRSIVFYADAPSAKTCLYQQTLGIASATTKPTGRQVGMKNTVIILRLLLRISIAIFMPRCWQGVVNQDDDLRVVGYACIGKNGIRNRSWQPEANWARSVLHSPNLQTEWSELPDNARRDAGRLAGVARMPFGAAGIANAITALAALPRTF